jgi:hydroxyethylthiazole kinase-like uncharacterized protein yjeF
MISLFKDVNHLDLRCYKDYNMSEDLLMEHAALGLKNAITKDIKSVLIVAGAGNNGADGIALARMLQGELLVKLYLPMGAKSDMAKLQLKRANLVGVEFVENLEEDYDLIVDAIFGSGLNRDLSDEIDKLISDLNQKKAFKISCDIPTGVDLVGCVRSVAFKADITVTMGAYKEALFSDMAKDFVGEIIRVGLGVSNSLYESKSDTFLLESSDLKLPHRTMKNTHKGNFGHLCVVAGKMPGAGVIAAKAALSFGVGKVTVVENEPYTIPYELMSSTSLPPKITAICIGMGLGNQYDDEYLFNFLSDYETPLLVDADLFYEDIILEVLKKHKNLVLTPHPREFVELLKITSMYDISVDELQKDRLKYAREFSKIYPDAVLLLKGSNSIIIKNSKAYIQPLGSSVLSKGGSGDVLGGLIAALLAQGYEPLDATISGSLAHALAGERFSKNSYALTPLDLIEEIKCL